jgi:hypothetical protein
VAVAPTTSNRAAPGAVAAGLLAVVALPAGIALAQVSARVKLLQASAAIPVAAVLGVAALLLARRAIRRSQRTLGRAGGEGAARAGRILGVLGLCIAASGAIAVAFYEVLVYYQY